MRQAPERQEDADDGEVAAYLGTIDEPPPNMNAATLEARQATFMRAMEAALADCAAGRSRDYRDVMADLHRKIDAHREREVQADGAA